MGLCPTCRRHSDSQGCSTSSEPSTFSTLVSSSLASKRRRGCLSKTFRSSSALLETPRLAQAKLLRIRQTPRRPRILRLPVCEPCRLVAWVDAVHLILKLTFGHHCLPLGLPPTKA